MKVLLAILVILGVVAYNGCISASLCFTEPICSGNPSNAIRGRDRFGSGAYGARRGSRKHNGIDVKCPSDSTVYSPFPAKFIRIARPYGNGKPHDIGVLLVGTGQWSAYSVKMFYVSKTVNTGALLGAGDQIGSMVNMAVQYGKGMTNHIHVQLYKNRKVVDPTNFFC